MWSSSFVLRATLAYISLVQRLHLATAQTTYWSPGATCQNGGTYQDPYGGLWSVNCYQENSVAYYDSAGTSGQGIYGCFKGCSKRPDCNGISFIANPSYTQTATTGGGTCYYRTSIGSYASNSSVYASANLIGYAPSLPVSSG